MCRDDLPFLNLLYISMAPYPGSEILRRRFLCVLLTKFFRNDMMCVQRVGSVLLNLHQPATMPRSDSKDDSFNIMSSCDQNILATHDAK